MIRRPTFWLGVIAVLHAVVPLLILGLRWPLGPDETVYLSQYNAHVPALFFSAPRARGPALIAAPITLITPSVTAVRIWVSVLSGLGLWLAFRPWSSVIRGWVVPAAAAGFATLWTVALYGPEVMPNEWVAFATSAAAGLVVRWLERRCRRDLIGAAVAVSIVGLLRPSDASYATAGMVAAILLTRQSARDRVTVAGALVGGVVIGVAEWLVEAMTSYGGVVARIHAAQAEQGGSGLFWAGGAQARVLAGPLLCRNGCQANADAIYQWWWVVGGALALVGVVDAVRRRCVPVVVAATTGIVVAGQYLFTVPYAAPRFLLPAYALMAITVMRGAQALVRGMRHVGVRRVTVAGLCATVAVNTAVQLTVLTSRLTPAVYDSAQQTAAEADALRRAGLRGRCAVMGKASNDLQLSYLLGCTNGPMSARARASVLESGVRIIWLGNGRPDFMPRQGWTEVSARGSAHVAWLSAGKK